MAAEATFHIRAVDATRSGFASVQSSLSKIQTTAKTISRNIGTAFGATIAVAAIQKLNQGLEDVEKNAVAFGLSAVEISRVTRATGLVDDAAKKLKKTLATASIEGLAVTDALAGISDADSLSIADRIKAERDLPKIIALNEAIADLADNTRSLGDTDVQKFLEIENQIEGLGAKFNLPENSEFLNKLSKSYQIQVLRNQQAVIATDIGQTAITLDKELTQAKEKLNLSTQTEIEQQKTISKEIEKYQSIIDAIDVAKQDFLGPNGNVLINTKTIPMLNLQNDATKELIRLIGLRKIAETDFQIIAKNTGDILSSGFEDAIFSGRKLSEVVKALGLDLMRMIFQQLVTAPLARGITNAILGKASGGPVSAGTPYVVGEKGPELFVSNSSGSIIPNSKMGSGSSGAGGTNVNVTYNIASGVSRSDLAPILEQQRKLLKAEIPDMVRRGGGYRAAFA